MPTPVQDQLAHIDWRSPWWQPWRALGQQVAQQVIAGARVCDALNAQQGLLISQKYKRQ